MRKFSFQELAYAVVVASSYGLLMGLIYSKLDDILMILVWVFLICAHLSGIITIEKLEQGKNRKRDEERKKRKILTD